MTAPGKSLLSFARVAILALAGLAAIAAAAPARAWDLELNRALMRVWLGTATPAERLLVIKNNDTINRMASTGHVNDRVYQEAQKAFAEFNRQVAAEAAQKNGLDLVQQVRKSERYSPGTDSDYITRSRTDKMTPAQIEKTISDYNAEMNSRLGTEGVDYAKKLNTDFMANPAQMSAEDFAKVAALNNDAYKRQASAAYEAKVRAHEPVTVEETLEYQKEMTDFIAKKGDQIKELEAKVRAAAASDPDALLPETRDLVADLQVRRQQQAKYLERFVDATQRMADASGVEMAETSDLASSAADRSIKTDGTQTTGEKAIEKGRTSGEFGAKAKRLVDEAKAISATVDAATADRLRDAPDTLPTRDMLLDSAAAKLKDLSPSQQADAVDAVRAQSGDEAARDLLDRLKKVNGARATAPADEPPVPAGEAKAAAAKAMEIMAIASTARDVRAWVAGEKSNWEAAVSAADMLSMGYYSVGVSLSGWKQAYDANLQAFATEQQARIFQIAKDLHSRGVGVDEVMAIVADLETGWRRRSTPRSAGLQARARPIKSRRRRNGPSSRRKAGRATSPADPAWRGTWRRAW